MIARGATPRAQRFSIRLLHACRLPRASRHARTDLAGRDDGAGGGDGIRRAPCSAACSASRLFWHALDIVWVGRIHGGLSDGSESMTEARYERAPGDRPSREMHASAPSEFLVYTIGLFVAVLLTATSFWAANTTLLWPGGVFLGLAVLAIAQMGIHLVFFLHITTRAGKHQQCPGARLRRAHRIRGGRRLDVDHGRSEPEHADAVGRADEHADAALTSAEIGGETEG